ncbi:MAG: molecular chaperone HtpG, partial [Desulfuromonadaceae bacterium]
MTANKHVFKAEVNKILDLMIHSLYSHKEIFLRELISNASDAIDKARYESLTDQALAEGGEDWKIQLIVDKTAGTLTVRDNGIGMTRDEAVEALGTIAHSGTKEFLKLLESREVKDNPALIGQFGVGFYSSFMVADKVRVITRKAGTDAEHAVAWESNADGTYTLDDVEKASKGTDVILTLKEDAKDYLEEWELRKIVKQYSDFIEYPVVMEVTRTKPDPEDKDKSISETAEETLNSRKAIWLKDKADISSEEYNEFYKHVSHDFGDPARVIHYRAEGTTEFSALLYLPKKRPFDIFYQDYKVGPTLYVRRVQIMDHCEAMLPPYLRFVR